MKCSCGHVLRQHVYNQDLQSYDNCKLCECEGLDIVSDDSEELYLGR